MERKASIGDIVHYTNLGDKDGRFPPETQAAIITGVYTELDGMAAQIEGTYHTANKVGENPNSMRVDLRIFYRDGEFNMKKVPFSEAPVRGHWNFRPQR